MQQLSLFFVVGIFLAAIDMFVFGNVQKRQRSRECKNKYHIAKESLENMINIIGAGLYNLREDRLDEFREWQLSNQLEWSKWTTSVQQYDACCKAEGNCWLWTGSGDTDLVELYKFLLAELLEESKRFPGEMKLPIFIIE